LRERFRPSLPSRRVKFVLLVAAATENKSTKYNRIRDEHHNSKEKVIDKVTFTSKDGQQGNLHKLRRVKEQLTIVNNIPVTIDIKKI
jgi:hypothetical protein